MVILDTNILSALMKWPPESRLIRCLDQFAPDSIWTTSINVFEIGVGLMSMPKGKRQRALATEFESIVRENLDGRVLEFDEHAAERAAEVSTRRRFSGRSIEVRDVLIAGIVESRHGVLVTRNARHFESDKLKVINPWNDE